MLSMSLTWSLWQQLVPSSAVAPQSRLAVAVAAAVVLLLASQQLSASAVHSAMAVNVQAVYNYRLSVSILLLVTLQNYNLTAKTSMQRQQHFSADYTDLIRLVLAA